MRILITGAGGLVGSHLAKAFPSDEVARLRHRDLDIADRAAVDATVDRLRPDVIFNCAVIGVDACEEDPALAERINVSGPAYLATAAERVGATLVHFSSNYVFDGERSESPYTIDDEPRPVNAYGATKLRGERAVTAGTTRALIVRTSWVFGAGKESFLSTVAARLARRERVKAIADTFASTTYVRDLIDRVMALLRLERYDTYHVVNDGICSYDAFAREAARIVGVDEGLIEPVREGAHGRRAPRPRWTPMRCLNSERLGLSPMRPWQQALSAYIHDESAIGRNPPSR